MQMCAQLRSIFFTRGTWAHMSGMVDVLLHCSEAGQKDLRLVGPRMHEYTMSTCYFLGNRPQLQLELVSLKPPVRTRAPAHAAATRDTARWHYCGE